MNKTDSFLHRLHLRARERQIVRLLRNQVAAASSILEVVLAILVLIGLLISTVPIAQEMFNLVSTRSTEAFQTFLGHAFNLVIGIEFIKMLAKHSPGSALEVLLYAIARNMILDHGTAVDNLFGVLCIGLIFVIRKFCFVPSFGATMPGGEIASDMAALFGKNKPAKAAESKDAPDPDAEICSPEEGLEGPEPDITETSGH